MSENINISTTSNFDNQELSLDSSSQYLDTFYELEDITSILPPPLTFEISSVENSLRVNTTSKQRSKKSLVWDFFKNLGVNSENIDIGHQCNDCGQIFSSRSSTGTLKSHLKGHKGLLDGFSREKQQLLNFNTTLNSISNENISEMQTDNITIMIAHWLVKESLPFSTVESKTFLQTLQYINSNVKLPTRNTFIAVLKDVYKSMKFSLKKKLKNIPGKISITLDIWTSRSNMPFLAITGHYVNDDWILQKLVLDLPLLPHPHNATDIFLKVLDVLKDFEIEKKVLGVTTDNGPNMVASIRLLKSFLLENHGIQIAPRRCIAHVLDLVVKSGLEYIKPSLEKVRGFTNTLANSSLLSQQLRETAAFSNLQREAPHANKIPQDVPTRWNSTYLMMHAYSKMPTIINVMIEGNPSLQRFRLTLQEQATLFPIMEFLEPFYNTTKTLSGSTYSTMALALMLTDDLILTISHILSEPSQPQYLKDAARKMAIKFEKYKEEFYEPTAFFASILDPRIKTMLIPQELNKENNLQILENILRSNYNNENETVSAVSLSNMGKFIQCFLFLLSLFIIVSIYKVWYKRNCYDISNLICYSIFTVL